MDLTRRDFSHASLAAILASQTAPFIVRAQDAKKYREMFKDIKAPVLRTELEKTAAAAAKK